MFGICAPALGSLFQLLLYGIYFSPTLTPFISVPHVTMAPAPSGAGNGRLAPSSPPQVVALGLVLSPEAQP